MSPKAIKDKFSHIPGAVKRMRLRWTEKGLCNRCGREPAKMGCAECQVCLDYHKENKKKRSHAKNDTRIDVPPVRS